MLSQPRVRTFDLKKLPRVSREEAGLVNALYRYLPLNARTDEICGAIEKLLSDELGSVFSFKLSRLLTVDGAPYLQTLPRPGLFLVIGMVPLEEKAFCDIDLVFAHTLVDRLLGGEGEASDPLHPFSELEEGVLSYLALKVFSLFYELCGASARVHFRLHGVASSPDHLKPFLQEGARMVVLTMEARLGGHAGYFRLLFPSPFVQKAFLEPAADFTAAEKKFYRERIGDLGFVRTHLWAEAGRGTVRPDELRNLKEGDVILLDRADRGRPLLRVGGGETAAYQGALVAEDESTLKVRLEEGFYEHPVGEVS